MSKFFTRQFFFVIALLGIGFIILQLTGDRFFTFFNQRPTLKIATTQIAKHPSLDLIRQGLEDTLIKEGGFSSKEMIFENAQGSIATATQIASRFVSLKPKVIVAISTPSAQSAYNKAKDEGIPVIFSAVSDPIAAKLTMSFEKAGDGITGVSDLSPLQEQLQLMRSLLPNLKRFGIVYNPGEANSKALIKRMEVLCKSLGIEIVLAAALNTQEVITASKSLAKKVEAIYIPNDNTVVSGLEGLLAAAKEHHLAVFCADPESVERGALACVAASQYGLGVQTAKMVIKLLNGEDINNLPVETPLQQDLVINLRSAKDLGISIPSEILFAATKIITAGGTK